MIHYKVGGRNGQYSIDEYIDDVCVRQVDSFRTRKQANTISTELNRLAEQINSHVWWAELKNAPGVDNK